MGPNIRVVLQGVSISRSVLDSRGKEEKEQSQKSQGEAERGGTGSTRLIVTKRRNLASLKADWS